MALEFDVQDGDRDKSTVDNVLKGLDLYTRTLQDVQILVPSRLPGALAGLKKKPLLDDQSLQGLEDLRLDIHQRWCGEEIQYFTPFIRHDDLEGAQARDMLMSWAQKAGEALLGGVRKTLERMTEFKAIVELRTRVMEHWIREGGKAKGFDPAVMLNGLRSAINARLLSVLDTKVSRLRLVGSEVAAGLQSWKAGTSDRYHNLWDEDMLDMDVSNGPGQVTHEILARLHGKNDAVSRACTSYESWFQLIDIVNEVVDQLRHQRWDNDIDEIENEETIEARQELLSKEDPQEIHERLHTSLEQAFRSLEDQLGSLWLARKDGPDSGLIAMYLIRVLRTIRGRLPRLESTKSFGLKYVPSFHEKVVAHVCTAPIEEFTSTALLRKRVTGRILWEGEPALPTQPSPDSFKLLRNLVSSMGEAGLDLWSPTAVRTLKHAFAAQLCDAWKAALADDETGAKEVKTETGDVKAEEEADSTETTSESNTTGIAADERKQLLIQWLYDIFFLQWYLSNEDSPDRDLKKLADMVFEKTGLQNETEEKMTVASQEYWKRTSLLFGLLA
jgi:conserved oligomeric Golgi complex subunit 1